MPESVINNDQRYIDGLLKNDDKIIAAIYRNFAGKINHWICANSGTSDDAADIFQESIISIYRQAKDKKLMLNCRSEEHTSELHYLLRYSYALFSLNT